MIKRTIDLIVPVYRNAEITRDCINSITNNWREIAEFEPRLVIVNDSPDDAQVNEMLASLKNIEHRFILMTNEHNLGFVKSVNRALEFSACDKRDVILINSDTLTFPNTLKELVALVALDEQIAFACPRSNNACFCTFPHSIDGAVGQPLTPYVAFNRWNALKDHLPPYMFTPTAVGFYMYIKREILLNFGGLREDFGVGYEEENDLVMRANKVGYRAAITNRSFVFHHGSASFNLTSLELDGHRANNLARMSALHPEFIPLLKRYEGTAYFRAEKLLGGLLPGLDGRYSLLIDLSALGEYYNGTSEHSVVILKHLSKSWCHRLDIAALCPQNVFEFHELQKLEGLRRIDDSENQVFTFAVRLGQPFDLHHINVLEKFAPVNAYGMLDTIALDCGHLAITTRLEELWGYVAAHSNTLFYISEYSARVFENRFPLARKIPSYKRLFPSKVDDFVTRPKSASAEHILVLGNHFPHKASLHTADFLAKRFDAAKVVVLGRDTYEHGNLRSYRAGGLEQSIIDSLYDNASVVVLPSFEEGFGLGVMHAIAVGKPIVARNLASTREILESFDKCSGIYLYEHNEELREQVKYAIEAAQSDVSGDRMIGWHEWVDGFVANLLATVNHKHIFEKLVSRLEAGDSLRAKQFASWKNSQPVPQESTDLVSLYLPFRNQKPLETEAVSAIDLPLTESIEQQSDDCVTLPRPQLVFKLNDLIGGTDQEFVEDVYKTLLGREPDSQGRSAYLEHLANGKSRAELVIAITESPEGKARGVVVSGMEEARVTGFYSESSKKQSFLNRILGKQAD